MNVLMAILICSGIAPTSRPTKVEIEIKPPDKVSTIRYEFIEGSLAGTAYVQSIGMMNCSKVGSKITYRSGAGPNATMLRLTVHGDHISEGRFSHYSSGMKETPVDCSFEEGGDSGHSESPHP